MAGPFKINSNIEQQASLGNLIIKNFGLSALKVDLYKQGMPVQPDQDPALYTSKLGTAVLSDLDIAQITYIDSEKSNKIIKAKGLQLETVLFTVEQPKNIVVTQVLGRNGTVKEYISDNDYIINIKGVIAGDNGVYPREKVKNLFELLRAPVPLLVNSWYLNQFNIFNVVVRDFTFPQTRGYYSQQMFEINCFSDQPIELLLSNA